MDALLALGILSLTIALALIRPRLGTRRMPSSAASGLGALLAVLFGLVSLTEVGQRLRFLVRPLVTLVCLMAITVVAARAGLFRRLAWAIARAAGGDGRKLYGYLFLAGTVTGALFSNDAAVLIFTPLVLELTREIADDSWSPLSRRAFCFGALYVANLVGLLLLSNPINLVVGDIFNIGFAEYTAWMALPTITSVIVTYVGLRIFFRADIPKSYRIPQAPAASASERRFAQVCGAILVFTLAGCFSEPFLQVEPMQVTLVGASMAMLAYWLMQGGRPSTIVRGIGWDVILFVMGIFIVASAMRNSGATAPLGQAIRGMAALGGEHAATFVTALLAALSSAIMNNHPVAQIMALTIEDMPYRGTEQLVKVLAALIGGDLGPKMLPMGSLAALLWFRILGDDGLEVGYRRYIALGVPVTLAAVVASTAVLIAQYELWLRL